jgi:hypothetical protein
MATGQSVDCCHFYHSSLLASPHCIQPFLTEVTAEGFLNKALLHAPVPPNPHDASVAVVVKMPTEAVKDAEIIQQ